MTKQVRHIDIKSFPSMYVSIVINYTLLETSYFEESSWATGVWQDHSKIDAKMFSK